MHGEASPALRASDADRDHAAGRLRDGLASGRLTLDEFSERVDGTQLARTVDELTALTADLPEGMPGTAPATGRRTPARWSVAIFGGVSRRSRWRLPARSRAVAVMGGCELDLRAAEIESPEVEITAVAVMGGVDITVPEGVEVELTGLALFGGKGASVKDVAPIPGAPFVRVRAFALFGGVHVRSRPTLRRQAALEP